MELTNKELTRFWAKVEKRASCWTWTGATKQGGYGKVTLRQTQWLASRLSWVIHHGSIPDGMDICHHCDNPTCVNPKHLFLGTRRDNMQDAKRKGRIKWPISVGSENGRAYLHEMTVRRILLLRGAVSARKVAEWAQTSKENVECIWARRSWKHIHVGVAAC